VGVRAPKPALPAGLVLAGAVSVQTGAGFATRLFGQLPPASVTTLRLWSAALIMVALAGLRRRAGWRDAAVTVAFGVALGFMNFAIYQAFARVPLGIAVTIEFLGPLTVTVAGAASASGTGTVSLSGRRALSLGYAALAALGVVLLAHGAAAHLNWAGVAWAVAAGAAWACYILGSKTTGQRMPGSSGLVVAMCVAAVVVTPPGVVAGAGHLFRPSFLAEGAAIGLLSSVIPYWLELEALRRVPAQLFGVWMSMQPAVAALIGLAMLSQRLSPAEWAGIGCVVAASAASAASSSRSSRPTSSASTEPVTAEPDALAAGAAKGALP